MSPEQFYLQPSMKTGLRTAIQKLIPIILILGTQKLKIDEYHESPRDPLSKVSGHKIDGVIGNDLLHRYIVKIDYQNKELSLFDNQELITYPDGEELRIEVNSLVSSIPLIVIFPGGKKIEGEFMIDTGAPINVLINSPVAEKNELHTILKMNSEKKFRTLADVQTAVPVVAESVKIGKFECADVEIYISTTSKGLFAVSKYAGIVGNKFFQNFNVIFDYKRQKLHLEKY